MADNLIEKVKDAVRGASPYWNDHMQLTDDEARAAIAVTLQAAYNHCKAVGSSVSEINLLAFGNDIKLNV
jgi:alkylhydroperoxidase family enzyme